MWSHVVLRSGQWVYLLIQPDLSDREQENESAGARLTPNAVLCHYTRFISHSKNIRSLNLAGLRLQLVFPGKAPGIAILYICAHVFAMQTGLVLSTSSFPP